MEGIKRRLTEASVIFVIALALLAALELAAQFARVIMPRRVEEPPLILKQPWGRQYLADQARLGTRYEDYVEFREKALASPTINVDERGRRVTPGSCKNPKGEAFRVLLFGGSTMFGYGVPDPFTIPAYLAAAFARSGRCVDVINYGAGWWHSSQSTVQLLKALREGIRPDAVVFYDGINDVSTVIRGGEPGRIAPEAEVLLASALEDEVNWKKVARRSALVRALAARLPAVGVTTPAQDPSGRADPRAVAKRISEVYVHNVRAVDALAREYGFTAYFFLQPFPLVTRKANTDLENMVIQRWTKDNERELALIREAYDAWRAEPYLRNHARFHDISNLFDGMSQELYADTQHLLPEGNRIVAERMAREIRLSR